MGHTKKILAHKEIPSIPIFLADKIQLELAENFHLHYRNLRIEMDHNEFKQLAFSFIKGYALWFLRRKPKTLEYKKKGDNFLMLNSANIPAIPSFFNENTSNTSLRVELQKWADYVHLHYKEFRFDMSVDEFKAYSDVIIAAREELDEELDKEHNPKRLGLFHRPVPFSRVQHDGPANSYWLESSDVNVENLYESTYSAEDNAKLNNRYTEGLGIYNVNIDDLYNITLMHSKTFAPWGVDDNSVFLPLLNRYDFVKYAYSKQFKLSDDEIAQTSYYKLLEKNIHDIPRDGQTHGVYKYPLKQAKKFLKLMKSVFEKGYLSDDIIRDDFEDEEMLDENNNTFKQGNRTDIEPTMISVNVSSGALKVHNGLHRLAILRVMYEEGVLESPNIQVAFTQKRNIEVSDVDNIGYDENYVPKGISKRIKPLLYYVRKTRDSIILVVSAVFVGMILIVNGWTKKVLKYFRKIIRTA
jgi:hypothetical protein